MGEGEIGQLTSTSRWEEPQIPRLAYRNNENPTVVPAMSKLISSVI